MQQTFRIEVTQDDIDRGCREDAENCAVARAVARCVPATAVSVDFGRICFTTANGVDWTAKTPPAVGDWIGVFDMLPHTREIKGEPDPEPFAFDLTAERETEGSV